MSVWRPIETAPKDGSRFLAYVKMVAHEEDENGRVIQRNMVSYYMVVAYWADFMRCFAEFPFNNSFPANIDFTHWMPLPEPPK